MVMSDKNTTFAADFDDEPTALATDGGGCPILQGEDAERFILEMGRTSRLAEERRKHPKPPTREDLERRLSFIKMILPMKRKEVDNLEKEQTEILTLLNG